jgi:predicted O-methyltransferase YrrM
MSGSDDLEDADLAAVLALRGRDTAAALPLGSDWALSPQVLLEVVRLVSAAGPAPTVVELGSGDSTLWIAQTLADRGDGRLVSFEHDEKYACRTRRRLAEAGLAEWVDLRVAPLRAVEIERESYLWYSTFEDLERIDLLLVDGPPGDTGRCARLPALPLLLPALADGAVVLLDDVDRADEQEILDRWVYRSDAGRTTRVDRVVDRAAVLLVQT